MKSAGSLGSKPQRQWDNRIQNMSLCNFICIVNNLNGRALVKTCALLLLPGKLGLNFSWLNAKENWLPRGAKLGNTGFVGAF